MGGVSDFGQYGRPVGEGSLISDNTDVQWEGSLISDNTDVQWEGSLIPDNTDVATSGVTMHLFVL